MSKQFWAIIVVIVLLLVGVFVFTGHKGNNTGGNSGTAQPTNHVEGQGKSGVTLLEYGDYECPFCDEYYPTVKQVVQQYDQLIHFQFRNFPLTSVHPNAFAAARAAEAAALQGKFWEMHDTLYEQGNWQQWSTSKDPTTFFNQYAQSIGLNVSQFKSDFTSDKVNATVNADLAAANKLGLSGTPTFFVDGKQIQIGNDIGSFQKVLNAEIQKKDPSATLPTATSAQ